MSWAKSWSIVVCRATSAKVGHPYDKAAGRGILRRRLCSGSTPRAGCRPAVSGVFLHGGSVFGAELDGPDVVAVRVLDDGGQEHAVEYELVHRVLPAVSWALSFTRIDSGGARTHRLGPSRPTDEARHGRSCETGGCAEKLHSASATRSGHRSAFAFPHGNHRDYAAALATNQREEHRMGEGTGPEEATLIEVVEGVHAWVQPDGG